MALEAIKRINALAEDVPAYNNIRSQLSLHGNTPEETVEGKPLDINHYKTHFESQKILRITPKPTKLDTKAINNLKKQNLIPDNSSIRFLVFLLFWLCRNSLIINQNSLIGTIYYKRIVLGAARQIKI